MLVVCLGCVIDDSFLFLPFVDINWDDRHERSCHFSVMSCKFGWISVFSRASVNRFNGRTKLLEFRVWHVWMLSWCPSSNYILDSIKIQANIIGNVIMCIYPCRIILYCPPSLLHLASRPDYIYIYFFFQ